VLTDGRAGSGIGAYPCQVVLRSLIFASLCAVTACAADAPQATTFASSENLRLSAENVSKVATARLSMELPQGRATAEVFLPGTAVIRAPDGNWHVEAASITGVGATGPSPFALGAVEALRLARSLGRMSSPVSEGEDSVRGYMARRWIGEIDGIRVRAWLGYRDALPRRLEVLLPSGTRTYEFYDYGAALMRSR
jgi:hypothetical protein